MPENGARRAGPAHKNFAVRRIETHSNAVANPIGPLPSNIHKLHLNKLLIADWRFRMHIRSFCSLALSVAALTSWSLKSTQAAAGVRSAGGDNTAASITSARDQFRI